MHTTRITALAVVAALAGCTPTEETTIIQQTDSGPKAPTLLFVEPSMGSTLGGTGVVLTGVNFVDGATVTFGTAEATNVDVVSGSTIFCDTPPGSVGFADITITNPGAQIGVRRKAWEYRVPPQIFSVMPPSGSADGGQLCILRGLDFQAGCTLTVAGTAVTGFVRSATGDRIDFVTPPGTIGAASVVVTNPDTLADTAAFTYVAAGNDPSITTVVPSASLPTGGGTVTITGSNFQTAGTTALYFDTTPATGVSVASATMLTATIPSGTAGTRVDLTLVNPNGLSVTTLSAFGYDTATTPPTFAGATAAVPTSPWSMRIEWAPAVDNVSPPNAITYQVYLATTSGGQNFGQPSLVTDAGQVSVTLGGLSAGSTTYVVVRATDEMGSQEYNTAEVSGTLPAAPTPAWRGVASFAMAREDHATVLLDDGSVLVTGGAAGPGAASGLASTEVFDPATGVWTAGPSLGAARFMHTASLLPSGDVLVAGGDSGSQLLGSTELWTPGAASWTSAGTLGTARREHTATLLRSGAVLVAGGLGSGAVASAELYVPGTGWTATGAMGSTRVGHTATLLADGRVLVVGGDDGTGTLRASAELYDPSAGTWTATGNLAAARRWHTATRLPNGDVLVAGGDSSGALSSCERYLPGTGTWTSASALSGARMLHTATLLPNGQVVVTGGDNVGALNAAEIYDASADTWAGFGSMSTARFRHTATLMAAGEVLVAGGENASTGTPAAVASVEQAYVGAGRWITGPSTKVSHGAGFSLTRMPDGRVLAVTGTGTYPYVDAEVYDPALGAWTQVPDVPVGSPGATAYIYYQTSNLLHDGRVLVSPGYNYTGSGYKPDAYLFDPATDTWTVAGTMNSTYRLYHTSHTLPSGKVIVVAGLESGSSYSPNCELYDPATNTWTATGSMNVGRYAHASTVLADGRVLAVGGYNASSGGYQSSCEIYTPSTGTWTTVSSLPFGRSYLSAILLPSGHVLAMGGYGSNGINTSYRNDAYLYDVANDSWGSAGFSATGGYYFSHTLLPSGRVLMYGGYYNGYQSTTNIFDPSRSAWEVAGSLPGGVYYHQATLLQDGTVLSVPGYYSSGGSSTGTLRFTEGRGASDAWRPRILSVNGKNSYPVTLSAGSTVTIGGVRLHGISEAHGGDTRAGAHDRPVVAIEGPLGENGRSMIYGQSNDSMVFLPTAAYAADGSSITLTMPSNGALRKGFYYLRVTANGMHSGGVTVFIP